jgi:HAD superfamily hydrolase (TIGR01450 family)
MPDRPTSPTDLRAALHGVEGFVLDADGVLILKGRPLPGSIDALRTLETRGIPFRVVTNFSLAHRSTLARRFAEADGLVLEPERIITASSAAAVHTATTYAGRPIVVLAAPDARREFEGQHLLSPETATAAPAGTVAAVVLGDAGDELSYRNMGIAFRLIRDGAAFLAMHRNPWWFTPEGVTLDAGAFVVGLEYSTGRRALVLGKPSPVVFRQALAGVRRDLGRRVPASAVAMVGDDPEADIRGAQRVGLLGVLVLTGKVGAGDVAALSQGRRRRPDAIAPSLADVVAALD